MGLHENALSLIVIFYLIFYLMKSIGQLVSLFSLLFLALLACSFTMPSATPVPQPGKWEKLGQKVVRHGLDRDVITVTYREGRFSKLKFKVLRSGLNMHRCVIHFGNGQTQEVALRNNFGPGGESRVIDIKGGRRVIEKVVFWHDSKSLVNRRRATLVLFGRH